MNWLHTIWFGYAWPSDLGNGPEAIQQIIIGAVLAVILWPPLRRRIHRFADRKIDGLKAHVESVHERDKAERAEIKRGIEHIIRHHPDIPPLPPLEP